MDANGEPCEEEGPPKLVHVRFSFDRIPMRRMHAALQHARNPYLQLLPVRHLLRLLHLMVLTLVLYVVAMRPKSAAMPSTKLGAAKAISVAPYLNSSRD